MEIREDNVEKRFVKNITKVEVEKNISDGTQQREEIVGNSRNMLLNWIGEMNKIVNFDDEVLRFTSDKYNRLTSQLLEKELLEIISFTDAKRLNYFIENIDVKKFEKRKKLHAKLLIYELDLINKYFLKFIAELTEIIKIPEERISAEFRHISDISDNINVILLHIQFMLSITTSKTLDKMMDRFNYDYDKSLKVLKEEIKNDCDNRFEFLFLLTKVLKNGNALAIEKEKLYNQFRKGKGLSKEKDLKYRKIAGIIKTFELFYPNIAGVQKKACAIVKENESSFSRWLNNKNTKGERRNYANYIEWTKNISPSDFHNYRNEINTYLNMG